MRPFWRGTLLSATALLLFTLTLTVGGCGGGGGGGGVSTEVLALLEMVPEDVSECTFLDLGEMRRNADLKDVYESATAELSGSDGAGVAADDVDRMVQAGSLTVLEGGFDLESLGRQLKSRGYTESDRRGTAVWQGPSSSVALVSASRVVTGWDAGQLADCVDVVNGDGQSFCDRAEVRGLLERLPGGFTVMVFAGGEGFDEMYQGVRATGYSLAKDGSHQARMSVILAFANAASAAEVEGDVEEMLTYQGGQNGASDFAVSRDGQYVKATARMPIGDALV